MKRYPIFAIAALTMYLYPCAVMAQNDQQSEAAGRIVSFRTLAYTGEAREAFTDHLDGRQINVDIQQYKKNEKLGRGTRRLDTRGLWKEAEKWVYYASINVTLDGKTVFTEKDIPYTGRVEYQYWDYTYGKWWHDTFVDNATEDDRKIPQLVRTVRLTDSFELRISVHNTSVAYRIVRLENPKRIFAKSDSLDG